MTLSRFLRDYLYIPLGGNRLGRGRSDANLMATMTLGGLWHGAAVTFVAWGALHGVFLTAERHVRGHLHLNVWVRRFIVVNGFAFTMIFFRSPNFEVATTYLSRFAHPAAATMWKPIVLVLTFGMIALQWMPQRPLGRVRVWFEGLQPAALAAAMVASILVVTATVPSQGVPPFIYFQF
jgi:D-alanyl-lipoteichoic acid acyltransferase DltB (MBOAT superfamily)